MAIHGVDQVEARRMLKDWKVEEGSVETKERKELPPIDPRVRDNYVRNLNSDSVRRDTAHKKFDGIPRRSDGTASDGARRRRATRSRSSTRRGRSGTSACTARIPRGSTR